MWQPIKTAPKDGTAALFWLSKPLDRRYVTEGKCPNITIGFWDRGSWASVETEDCGSMGGEYTGWMSDYVCLEITPSHWMPLPQPPTA